MPDTGELGIGYLVGTGSGLVVSAFGHLALVETTQPIHWFGVAVTSGLGLTLIFVGVWLWRNDLLEEHAWQVAIWCAVGLSIPTLVGILITIVRIHPDLQPLFQSFFIIFIAACGVVGVLIGSVIQLNRAHSTTRKLYQRTSVLNRFLRHNIRNKMNVILAQATHLKNDEKSVEEIADRIQHTGEQIVKLSQSVRRIDEHDSESRTPVDVVSVIADRAGSARTTFPHARITTDLPTNAWVNTTPLLQVAIDNLIENAIQHNDQRVPEVHITVDVDGSSNGWIEIRVRDNGRGIPEQERDVLEQEAETAVNHGSGIGLWLVKWYIDANNGELDFRDNEPRGSVVIMRLPAIPPPTESATETTPA